MATALPNYRLRIRPLRGGVGITSSAVHAFGTLTCIATTNSNDRWGVTASHVVSPMPLAQTSVFQADHRNGADEISDPHIPWRFVANADVVAFALRSGVPTLAELHELGGWRGVDAPVTGASLWKVGVATGVTRARVGRVFFDRFEVVPEPGMPPGYLAFEAGDSGAPWITQDQRRLVGVHVSQNPLSGIGTAIRLDFCLQRMGLALWI